VVSVGVALNRKQKREDEDEVIEVK
jgi:hypothetical protein